MAEADRRCGWDQTDQQSDQDGDGDGFTLPGGLSAKDR